MEREHTSDDLIDLGVATVETKGPAVGKDDHQLGLIPFTGIGDE